MINMKIMIGEILKVFLWISILKNFIAYDMTVNKAPDGVLEDERTK
jgi:hypothetical protein